ncbi:MAG: hypothetical protein QOJ30_2728, partial [Pseudonocardiales bacterium]|nr:hypothetical protein [Pseudonocardiales bacterium]
MGLRPVRTAAPPGRDPWRLTVGAPTLSDMALQPGSKYVAMGSSFAAGPGITPVLDRSALRSGRNYAHRIAETLELDLVDVTYSGATTATILTTPRTSAHRRSRRSSRTP